MASGGLGRVAHLVEHTLRCIRGPSFEPLALTGKYFLRIEWCSISHSVFHFSKKKKKEKKERKRKRVL